ncbi:MAG: endopeptidase La [Chloroflexota bacterium]|nr:endopeptidase La [Chloroflexota bacterium]
MASDTALEFKHIDNAEAESDGVFELPLLPLDAQVLFPRVLSLIPLTTKAQINAASFSREQKRTLIACKLKPNQESEALINRIHTVGTEFAPGKSREMADESTQLLAQGRRRVRILEVRQAGAYPVARASVMTEDLLEPQKLDSLADALKELFKHSSQYNEAMPDSIIKHILSLEDPGQLCDSLASILPLPADDLQQLLELEDVAKRLELLAVLLTSDLHDKEMHDEVHARLQDEIAANQREMYLREQVRIIQQELGDGDIFQQEMSQLSERIRASNLPSEVEDKAMKEMSRLGVVPPMSPESGVIHTYLDRLLTLPWNVISDENLNLQNAEEILERAHYGLSKVKARIIEHIAVRKLAKDKMKNPILCFVGPPGVGKTSLGKSISDALGCKFLRISLGGLRDEAEIRGHRRTYIGSMPGRILQQMERAETVNPVFMLDEIDKMSSDFRGDPASALLEVLDPEQNVNFVDHYLEVPYDLSKVTFITTANDLYSIPEALEDRLEVIEFKGYSEEEKIEIARRFLIPKQLEANGLGDERIRFSTTALQHIIRHYTYESGVRNLEREVARMCRRIARKVASERGFPRRITPAIIEKHLGPPQMLDSRVNRNDAIGIVSGLVWTPNGGDIQTVEVSLVPGKGNLMLTGQLGDVLQESAHIALSYLRARANEFGLPADDFENYDLHIHMPEGAVPKDGPSAGITLATALISAFTERPANAFYAMTGEITLRGHILPVGGVVEKILAARRRSIPRIILPKDNQKDMHDLPKAAKRDVSITFVEDMSEVLDLVLLEAPAIRSRDLEAEKRRPANDERERNEDSN